MFDLATSPASPPAFASARVVVADAFEELRFPPKIPISVANDDRILANPGAYSGAWGESPHDMRFTMRAMDGLGEESPYGEVIVEGPSQTAKSEIGNAWAYHIILHNPKDLLFVMPDREAVRKYVTTQFNKMLDANPRLRGRQLSGASSDNINLKQFRGCDFFMLHPVGTTFRAQPFSCGRLDDFDEFEMDISDQGTALDLLYGRMGSFEMYGNMKIYVNSTPKLGDGAGIAALLPDGTNERWWVDCLQCGTPFELDTEHVLKFDNSGTAEEAEASAKVACPANGCVHEQRDKRRLMGTGRWIGRGERAVPGGKEGELVVTKRLSQRWDGLMGMRSWSNMARLWRLAERKLEFEQDESGLKTFFQTVIGKNYVPKVQGEPSITPEQLQRRALASSYKLGEVPSGGQVLIASIDQQGNRFEVAIWAFGAGFRAWLVDRFALLFVNEDGRDRPLRPFTRLEDWSVLHAKVLSLTYPLAGAPHLRMKIFNTAIDTGGMDSATDNAFAWWHAMVSGDIGSGRAALPATAITLIKGGNKADAPLLRAPTVDAKRQIKGAPQAEMFIPNVNRFKDIFDTRLKRDDGGPGAIGLPVDMEPRHIAEMRAETNVGGQWIRESHVANETGDLYVYAYTVVVRFGGSDSSLSWVPEWARPPKGAPRPAAPLVTAPSEEPAAEEPAPAARPEPARPGVVRRQSPRRGVRVVRSR